MDKKPSNILQVCRDDNVGGAAKVASNLLQGYRARGLHSWLAVSIKRSNDPNILLMPRVSNTNRYNRWTRAWLTLTDKFSFLEGNVSGAWRVLGLLRIIAQPQVLLEIKYGHEDFDFPGSWHVMDLIDERPDILHCHNLHGSYFDLRVLPWLSHEVPTIITLHDAWLLSGHCAHSFECERWETGCGQCPDLTIYPAIKRDATAFNWHRKKNIYANSRLYVATPSRWLMHKVERSILAAGIVEARVIHNGVDLTVFHPGDQRKARAELGIPQNVVMLLFAGYTTRNNPWKDYATLEASIELLSDHFPTKRIILVCLGEEQHSQRIGQAEVQFIGFQNDPAKVASFYQAADLYLHPSKVDTFPNTVLEALACGKPVVATAIGGIPEQVRNGETGFLVPSKDVEALAKHIKILLTDDTLRCQFSVNAAQDARERFDLNHQVDAYIEWYRMICDSINPKMNPIEAPSEEA